MEQVTLGERELDVMTALWTDGPGTVAEVKERLPAALAYNTVLTILRNLEAKRLVAKFFGGSPVRVMAHLLENEALDAEDLKALHKHLNSRLAEMEKKGQ